MRNIVLARIDDRLIHGQVVTAWVKQTNGNRIVIADDPLTKDTFMQRLLKAAAPPGITVDILTTADAINFLKEAPESGENIILLAKVSLYWTRLFSVEWAQKKGGIGLTEMSLPVQRRLNPLSVSWEKAYQCIIS